MHKPGATSVPTLAAFVRERTGCSWSRAKALCVDGRVTVDGERVRDPAVRVRPDAVVEIHEHGQKVKDEALPQSAIVYSDRELVVVDKPAGLLSVADEEGNIDTLAHYTRAMLRKSDGRSRDGKLGVVHRLDRDTSGLMVFARTATAQRALAAQFRAHDLERVYHGLAHGAVEAARIETFLLLDRGDGLRGSFGHYRYAPGEPPAAARKAVTFVKPLQALEGATLIECRLETGRQHQIRIHLAERGHPLLGERVYIRDYTGPRLGAPRTMLHARTLGFTHPGTGRVMQFEREAPLDFTALLDALRH